MAEIDIKTFGPNIGTMVHQPEKAPDQVRFFDLEIDTTGNGLGFRVVNSGFETGLAGTNTEKWLKAEASVEQAIADSAFPNPGNAHFDQSNATGKRPRFSISLGNPRPFKFGSHIIGEARQCLFVFRLTPGRGNSKVNWRFISTFAPFSIGDRKVMVNMSDVDSAEIFSHAMHCDKNNQGSTFVTPEEDERDWTHPYPSSEWACFLYDYEKAVDLIGQESFVLRYNLHVEVEDIARPGQFIPIVIDPDVGHPGGNHGGPPN